MRTQGSAALHRLARAATLVVLAVLVATVVVPAAASAQAKIAFAKQAAGARFSHIWTIASDGTGLKRLTNSAAEDLAPAWSPKRGTIAFMRSKSGDTFDRRARLMLMRSDGTNERVLYYEGPSLTTGSQALAYSPNGRYLAGGAFLRDRYGHWTDLVVTILDLKTKKSRILAHIWGMNGIKSLSWSPGGSQLAVTTEDGGTYGSARIDVAKKRVINSIHGSYQGYVGLPTSVSWRPDGKYLLCSFWFIEEPGYPSRTQLVEPGGTVAASLGVDQSWPVYSPDGARYAFLHYGSWGGRSSLKYADGDGSNITTIYTGASGEQLSSPAWR